MLCRFVFTANKSTHLHISGIFGVYSGLTPEAYKTPVLENVEEIS
jgi:hypothetical protein